MLPKMPLLRSQQRASGEKLGDIDGRNRTFIKLFDVEGKLNLLLFIFRFSSFILLDTIASSFSCITAPDTGEKISLYIFSALDRNFLFFFVEVLFSMFSVNQSCIVFGLSLLAHSLLSSSRVFSLFVFLSVSLFSSSRRVSFRECFGFGLPWGTSPCG